MLTLDIDPNYLVEIQNILKEVIPEATVWAYGSRVSGQGHDTSDLDLVLRNSSHLEQRNPNLIRLKQAFRESQLPIFVDVMDWALLPISYRKEIITKHIILQHGQ